MAWRSYFEITLAIVGHNAIEVEGRSVWSIEVELELEGRHLKASEGVCNHRDCTLDRMGSPL